MAVLSGARFPHDLATPACLLLACRHAAMTVGGKGIARTRALVRPRRVKRQQPRRTVLHQSNPPVATAMHATLVAVGTFEPALHIPMVFWTIGGLSPHQHPRRNTAPPLGQLRLHGGQACLPRLPQRDARRLPFLLCGLVTWPPGALHGAQGLALVAPLRPGLACHRQAAVKASGQTRPQRLGPPPLWASTWRSSDARTAWNASLIRPPGGGSGPPWASLRMPRTAAPSPSPTSPASSATPAAPSTAPPVVSRALAGRPPPRALPAPAAGVGTAGRSVCGVSGAGQDARAAV